MLIDHTYFTHGFRHIQNASLGTRPNPNAAEVVGAIEAYIDDEQERFLTLALGQHVGNKVHTYLVCRDEGDEIRNDAIEKVCDKLREAFADYTFYRILRASNTQATITGLVKLKNANEYASPVQRQVMAWNSMVERMRKFAVWSATDECPLKGVSVDANLTMRINALNL